MWCNILGAVVKTCRTWVTSIHWCRWCRSNVSIRITIGVCAFCEFFTVERENNGQKISQSCEFKTRSKLQQRWDIPIDCPVKFSRPKHERWNQKKKQRIYSSHVPIDIWLRWWKCNFMLALRHLKSFRTTRRQFLLKRFNAPNRKLTKESMKNIFCLAIANRFRFIIHPYSKYLYQAQW